MTLPDFLTMDAAGEIRLTGHRIGLWHLVHYYNEGYSPEMLVCQYPTLPLAMVHKVIAYYLENRAAVAAYAVTCQAEIDRQRATQRPPVDAATLRRRLEAAHQQQASTAGKS
jgi:uncharacterized protein (DUF433 family)